MADTCKFCDKPLDWTEEEETPWCYACHGHICRKCYTFTAELCIKHHEEDELDQYIVDRDKHEPGFKALVSAAVERRQKKNILKGALTTFARACRKGLEEEERETTTADHLMRWSIVIGVGLGTIFAPVWRLLEPQNWDVNQLTGGILAFLIGLHQASKYSKILRKKEDSRSPP